MASLGISVHPDHWDKTTQSLTEKCPERKELQAKINTTLREYASRIKHLEEANELTLDNLFKKANTRRYKFIDDYFLLIVERLQSLGKYTSADKHKTVFSMIKKFHASKIRFEDIDMVFLRDFEHFLKQRKNNSNSIATKMSVFKAVYNKALSEDLFTVKSNPFSRYKVGSLWKPTRKRAITKGEIQQIIDLKIANSNSKDLARDIFLFSYYMAGINFGDMCHLTQGNIHKGRLYYTRRKTGKELSILITPQANSIIEKYMGTAGDKNEYIFPILNRELHKTDL